MGFEDITSGSNPGCGTSGFSVVQGWDPVTGFGTPDFLKLQDLVGLTNSQYLAITVVGFKGS